MCQVQPITAWRTRRSQMKWAATAMSAAISPTIHKTRRNWAISWSSSRVTAPCLRSTSRTSFRDSPRRSTVSRHVSPETFSALTSALRVMRVSASEWCPYCVAQCNGVWFSAPFAFTAAPPSSRAPDTSIPPQIAAMCSAESPFTSECTSAPAATRAVKTPGLSLAAATCKGVYPLPRSRVSITALAAISASAISLVPLTAVKCSGVAPESVTASTSAPPLMSVCATSTAPPCTAMCNGVAPSKSAMLQSAPAETSASAQAAFF
mmetsp:Transcript_33424/g.67825  ORF Transcript_33424/g.67825 Transcript_33424/m.67825 type:complete len:264 (-) Transcript_33424:263-1054(-)